MVELFESHAGCPTWGGALLERPGLKSIQGATQDEFPSGGLLIAELERDEGRTPS